MNNTVFSVTLVGEGWDQQTTDPSDVHDAPPNKKMTVKVNFLLLWEPSLHFLILFGIHVVQFFFKVKGRNPGYGATCTSLVLAAYTILKESDKMPLEGGVLPPGAAFANTSLISELNKHGLTFEVVSGDVQSHL